MIYRPCFLVSNSWPKTPNLSLTYFFYMFTYVTLNWCDILRIILLSFSMKPLSYFNSKEANFSGISTINLICVGSFSTIGMSFNYLKQVIILWMYILKNDFRENHPFVEMNIKQFLVPSKCQFHCLKYGAVFTMLA